MWYSIYESIWYWWWLGMRHVIGKQIRHYNCICCIDTSIDNYTFNHCKHCNPEFHSQTCMYPLSHIWSYIVSFTQRKFFYSTHQGTVGNQISLAQAGCYWMVICWKRQQTGIDCLLHRSCSGILSWLGSGLFLGSLHSYLSTHTCCKNKKILYNNIIK